MTTLNRHQARQVAFQTLYSLEMNLDANIEAVVRQVLAGDPEIEISDTLPQDVLDLVSAVNDHKNELDLELSQYLAAGWTIDRLSKVDLTLLRLALYEAKSTDTPKNVAINEALQLAHDFTGDDSRKFINAVLNKALTQDN
ncbi:transcription antitermination factor NusB [Weissella minor]|uniref:Transcription antitermination protein NusB n=1 Tax=Weissella minor TaxID=1620 RepID=A0A0R2JQW8_9LACO|nr:transcription antitermination factor NusB [Weissella minor]KRN76525.1 transcription antitermination protein NusB [Weissella minor]MBS0950250.1 transcription antitermination factor NusB [Weissella minor]